MREERQNERREKSYESEKRDGREGESRMRQKGRDSGRRDGETLRGEREGQ